MRHESAEPPLLVVRCTACLHVQPAPHADAVGDFIHFDCQRCGRVARDVVHRLRREITDQRSTT